MPAPRSLPDIAFPTFVLSLASSALLQLGELEVPEGVPKSEAEVNLPLAKQTIDIINPDETKTVVFRDFPSVDFGERRIMRIDVGPVPGEAKTDNKSAEYPIIFSLGA